MEGGIVTQITHVALVLAAGIFTFFFTTVLQPKYQRAFVLVLTIQSLGGLASLKYP